MATRRNSAQKKASPSQRSTKVSGLVPEFFDPKLEFDAPMFHHFGSQTPEAEHVDHWFDARLYEIQNHLFEEAKYSPITLQKHLQSKMGKVRTTSARKMKAASDSPRGTIPKMSLDDITEEAPRSASLKTARSPQTAVIKVVATEVRASQQPAVPFSELEKLSSLAMQPFVVAQPAPLPSPMKNQTAIKVEVPSQFIQDTRPTASEPPIRKRKSWEKPKATREKAWSPVKKEARASAIKSEAPQSGVKERPFTRSSVALKTATASTVASSSTPVAARVLTVRTPAAVANKLSSKTPVVPALKLPVKTPVAAIPKAIARTPLEPVAKKPIVAVASRYAQPKAVPSNPPLTRSRANKQEIKSNGRLALTKPKEFSFMSHAEVPKKLAAEEFIPEKIKELTVFPSLLRADSDPVAPQPKGLTRPVEFCFATSARAKTYAPLQAPQAEVSHPPAAPRGVTQPKEFRFATSARSRATAVSSLAPPKPKAANVHRRLTVPQAFNLSKSNRPKLVTEPPETRAKAKLAAKDMQQKKSVVSSRLQELALPVTRKRKSIEKAETKASRSKVSSAAVSSEPSLTVPEPFDLLTDVRGAEKADRFKRQIEEEFQQEKEAREVVARPLPSHAVDELPVVEPAPLTVFEPFHLESEHLAQQAKQRLEERIQLEQALDDEMRQFRAQPIMYHSRVPFRPLTSNRPLTVPETPKLQSSVRALDRADFSVEKNQRISMKEKREMQEKALEEEHEKEEIRKLRETLVFKAAPFVPVSPMRVVPSSRPLTVSETPRLRTHLRGMR